MRYGRIIALAGLGLLGLAHPAIAAPVAPVACQPTAPLNGAFCANELCSEVGATAYDKDGQTPLACVWDSTFNRQIWKPTIQAVSTGGGAGSYTAYGTQTCSNGWTVAYTGVVITSEGTTVAGVGFCINGNLSGGGNNYYSEGWNSGVKVQYNVQIPCAVCVKWSKPAALNALVLPHFGG